MNNLLGSLVGIGLVSILVISFILWKKVYPVLRRARIKKRDSFLRNYLKGFKEGEKLEIIDETPREVFVGDRFYLLKPLKYRQYTRLCILFAKMLQTLSERGITADNTQELVGDSMEVLEDEYFKAIALILFFSNNSAEEDEKKIFEGMQKEYNYLKSHASLDQISRILEVVQIQNDIERALKAFGLLGKKKMVPFSG